jgi:hypothetical protein
MKTTVVFVVALALGALLAYFLMPGEPPAPPPPPPHVAETNDAAVVVKLVGTKCKPRTFSRSLSGHPGDEFVWTTVAVGNCEDYVADLQIAVKNPAHEDELKIIDTTPGPERRATVPVYPVRCENRPPPCKIPYKVTVKSTDSSRPDEVEDPHIVIWP